MLFGFGVIIAMTRQVISSGWTIYHKSVVPLVLMAFIVLFAPSLFASPGRTILDTLIGILMPLSFTAVFCWFAARLKQVRIDEHNLYVAGFFKEISIPITAIESVGGFYNGSPVTLRLKEKSEFGRTIWFVAKWSPVLPWEAHPIFSELGQLIRKNQIG